MKYLDPKVKIEKIPVQFEENMTDEKFEDFTNLWGKMIPIVQINNEVFNIGNIVSFEYIIDINSTPKFILIINDEYQRFQAKFTDVDKLTGIIFLGNKIWYHKFNILITDVNPFGEEITLMGNIYNEKMFKSVQKSYNNISLLDILKDICTQTDLGLYSLSNEKLSQTLPLILNTNINYEKFLNNIVIKYTHNNFWCIDQYYMLHVQNYDTLFKKPIDKFTIKNGKTYEPTEIKITNYISNEELEEDNSKFLCYDFSINNNVGSKNIKTSLTYKINDDNINTYDKIGIGSKNANTFSKFVNNSKPFYKEIFDKEITGNEFEIELKTPIYEIFPFMVVDMEIFNYSEKENVKQYIINENQSGKKIIIGYSMKYNNPNFSPSIGDYKDKNEIVQKIKLI